jgi:hypothetical protein
MYFAGMSKQYESKWSEIRVITISLRSRVESRRGVGRLEPYQLTIPAVVCSLVRQIRDSLGRLTVVRADLFKPLARPVGSPVIRSTLPALAQTKNRARRQTAHFLQFSGACITDATGNSLGATNQPAARGENFGRRSSKGITRTFSWEKISSEEVSVSAASARHHNQFVPGPCGRHVMSTCTGISFLIGTVKSLGVSILKSDTVAGMVPVIRISFPCFTS